MLIQLARQRGFCYGVKRAVDMALSNIDPLKGTCTLGPIIHNPQMVNHLSERGIKVADQLTDVSEGVVIFRSHGVGPEIYRQAREKSLQVVDATCPHVKKAQLTAHKLMTDGYQVILAGERNHPEVQSIYQWTEQKAIIVGTPEEAMQLSFFAKIGVVAQTTFSGAMFQKIVDILKSKCNELQIDRTICTATDERQQAAVELARQVEVMIVVGGKNSANTARLAVLCSEAGAGVFHVETAAELEPSWFEGVHSVGITAGASTPEWLIEEVYRKMQEFDQTLNSEVNTLETGSIVKGKVVGIRKDEIFVDIGYKAEGVIPLTELAYPVPEQAADVVAEGQTIDVYVLDADSAEGAVKLSKVKADKIVAWDKLEQALEEKSILPVQVVEAVKGGLAVSVFGIRGFIPASQVELRFVEDLAPYAGQTIDVVPIEIDRTKQRVVLSRKVHLLEQVRQAEERVYAALKPGQTVKGIVSRLAKFGAFVDIGGVDGLIHISDLSWQRVASPEEVVNVGDEVEVVVLKVDPQAKRISLSLKETRRDPWLDEIDQFKVDAVVPGKVSKTARFGAFVELKPGIEGLIPLSELAERHVANAEEVVKAGQPVNVKILSIDKAAKRISLSLVKAQQEAERKEYQGFLDNQRSLGVTLGDKFAHLFKEGD
ncbi:ribosomal protein s1 [Lucifera butyrica]|uniref:4-hydroxy-3-methylbut-2-enyl diphosphate reductase n=1 Tax=Lucifera butyrica TaxID=1351585 RepID=A0A498R420_9FIRM|nr:bifunctional 4-hydroxy-3-methylbut-2-enyl diphosphate reductase/30S ribosomal protein S1 [Lucifera butyrica]VBB06171.1 ribosomal protein s1 [Lucifera butyrica]